MPHRSLHPKGTAESATITATKPAIGGAIQRAGPHHRHTAPRRVHQLVVGYFALNRTLPISGFVAAFPLESVAPSLLRTLQ
eukprot:75676-Alexandrium_andersonii.AAC.1